MELSNSQSIVFVVECVKLLVVVEDLVDHAVIVDIEKVDQRNRLVRGATWNQFFIRDLKAEFPGFLHINFIVMLLHFIGYLAQVFKLNVKTIFAHIFLKKMSGMQSPLRSRKVFECGDDIKSPSTVLTLIIVRTFDQVIINIYKIESYAVETCSNRYLDLTFLQKHEIGFHVTIYIE